MDLGIFTMIPTWVLVHPRCRPIQVSHQIQANNLAGWCNISIVLDCYKGKVHWSVNRWMKQCPHLICKVASILCVLDSQINCPGGFYVNFTKRRYLTSGASNVLLYSYRLIMWFRKGDNFCKQNHDVAKQLIFIKWQFSSKTCNYKVVGQDISKN
jgi:hypothetical protein